MTCCNEKAPLDNIYIPLNKRLIQFGTEIYGDDLNNIYKSTHMWVFTFYGEDDMCDDCMFKFSRMTNWFTQYGLFTNPEKNVKWILEDEADKNLIYQEMGFSKTPMHIFCNKNGDIHDIIIGFPTDEWLEKHILPLINNEYF